MYPAATNGDEGDSVNYELTGLAATRVTFRVRNNTEMNTLTTPIAYLTSYPPDPFANSRGSSFGYMDTGNYGLGLEDPTSDDQAVKGGWILICYGPDTDEGDDNGDHPESVYKVTVSQPSLTLLCAGGLSSPTMGGEFAYTYDPSNGTVSEGDVYRTKQ